MTEVMKEVGFFDLNYDIDGTLEDGIEFINGRAEILIGQGATVIVFDTDMRDWSESPRVYLVGKRPETADERTARLAKSRQMEKDNEVFQRRQYEALKKKFENT